MILHLGLSVLTGAGDAFGARSLRRFRERELLRVASSRRYSWPGSFRRLIFDTTQLKGSTRLF